MEHNEQNEIKYTSRTEKYHGPAKKKKVSVPDAGLSAQEAAQEEQPASPPEDTPEAVFDTEEGKALLKQWGIEGDYEGIGNCILGFPDETPAPRPRKENYVYYVR